MDSWRGILAMQTLRKLPTINPRMTKKSSAISMIFSSIPTSQDISIYFIGFCYHSFDWKIGPNPEKGPVGQSSGQRWVLPSSDQTFRQSLRIGGRKMNTCLYFDA